MKKTAVTTIRMRYCQVTDTSGAPISRRLVNWGAYISTDFWVALLKNRSRIQWGGVSSTRIESVKIEATRNSQLACFSLRMKSATLPPRRLPRLRPASITAMTLDQP